MIFHPKCLACLIFRFVPNIRCRINFKRWWEKKYRKGGRKLKTSPLFPRLTMALLLYTVWKMWRYWCL